MYSFFREKEDTFQEETILVVSHNIPIRCMIGSVYDKPWDEMRNNTKFSLKPGTAINLNTLSLIS